MDSNPLYILIKLFSGLLPQRRKGTQCLYCHLKRSMLTRAVMTVCVCLLVVYRVNNEHVLIMFIYSSDGKSDSDDDRGPVFSSISNSSVFEKPPPKKGT